MCRQWQVEVVGGGHGRGGVVAQAAEVDVPPAQAIGDNGRTADIGDRRIAVEHGWHVRQLACSGEIQQRFRAADHPHGVTGGKGRDGADWSVHLVHLDGRHRTAESIVNEVRSESSDVAGRGDSESSDVAGRDSTIGDPDVGAEACHRGESGRTSKGLAGDHRGRASAFP